MKIDTSKSLNLFRGLGWLVIGVVGLLFGVDWLEAMGVSPYAARRFGNLFTIAVAVLGSYRVGRDVFKIDPGAVCATGETPNPIAYAILQLGRILLCGFFAIAAVSGV